jgi:hypothetical protein
MNRQEFFIGKLLVTKRDERRVAPFGRAFPQPVA